MAKFNHEIRRRIAEAATEMCKKSLTTGLDAGDISVFDRDAGIIYALPRPCEDLPIRSWTDIRPEDVAVLSPDGKLMEGSTQRPTVEIPMHLRLYEARLDANAIVHSHGEWSQVFAAVGRDIPTSTIDTYSHLGFSPVRCGRFGMVASEELAVNMVEVIGKTAKAALMACHGAVCLGSDLDESMWVACVVERAARQALFAYQIGQPKQLGVEQVIADEALAARVETGEVHLRTETLQQMG
jgi:L-fuculose-phosphate aldolase